MCLLIELMHQTPLGLLLHYLHTPFTSFAPPSLHLHTQRSPERHALLYKDMSAVSRVVDRKILAIPVVFLFIRIWSMLRYLLSLFPAYLQWTTTTQAGWELSHFLIAMEVRRPDKSCDSHMTNMG